MVGFGDFRMVLKVWNQIWNELDRRLKKKKSYVQVKVTGLIGVEEENDRNLHHHPRNPPRDKKS